MTDVERLTRERDDARAELANQWRTFRQALDVSKDLAKYCTDYRAERDRAEEKVAELTELLGEERATCDEFALQRRADEAEIDRLQSRLRDAEVAMAGMVAELGERRAS